MITTATAGLRSQLILRVLLLSVLLLTACGREPLEAVPADGVIVAFGDSLTEGYGAPSGSSYPEVLADLTGRTVINAGISGELTASGLQRLPALLDRHDPDLLILMEGGNDILAGLDPAIIRQNLAAMIELTQARGITVILIGVPEKKLFSNTAPLYPSLADEYRLVHEGAVLADLLWDNAYKSDSIHFNAAGYRKLAERIHSLLMDAGAL